MACKWCLPQERHHEHSSYMDNCCLRGYSRLLCRKESESSLHVGADNKVAEGRYECVCNTRDPLSIEILAQTNSCAPGGHLGEILRSKRRMHAVFDKKYGTVGSRIFRQNRDIVEEMAVTRHGLREISCCLMEPVGRVLAKCYPCEVTYLFGKPIAERT
jgi:hypothetical protein